MVAAINWFTGDGCRSSVKVASAKQMTRADALIIEMIRTTGVALLHSPPKSVATTAIFPFIHGGHKSAGSTRRQ